MYSARTLNSPMATCGGATRIQLRASVRRAVKVFIPRKMETPMVGKRLGAVHEDVGLAVKRRSLFGRGVVLNHIVEYHIRFTILSQ
jgi:hypothetical protein